MKGKIIIMLAFCMVLSISMVCATIDNEYYFDDANYADCTNAPYIRDTSVLYPIAQDCNIQDGILYIDTLSCPDDCELTSTDFNPAYGDNLVTNENEDVLFTSKAKQISYSGSLGGYRLGDDYHEFQAQNASLQGEWNILQTYYNASEGRIYKYINGVEIGNEGGGQDSLWDNMWAHVGRSGTDGGEWEVDYLVTESGSNVHENIGVDKTEESETQYAYTESQFGNTNYIEGQESRNFTTQDNMTFCQPFVAPISGDIREFYVDGDKTEYGEGNAGTFKWIFSEEKERWHSTDTAFCSFSCGENTENWLEAGESVAFNVEAGQKYWLCMGIENLGDRASTLNVSETGIYPDIMPYQGVTSHYNGLVGDTIQEDYNMQVNYMVSGNFVGWSEVPYMVNDFQYCYETGGEKCFQLSNHNPNKQLYASSSTGVVGEAFKYKMSDSRIDNINLMIAKGENVTDSTNFTINLYSLNTNDNSLTNVYQSNPISASSISTNISDGYSLMEHSVEELIYLYKGQNYVVGVECDDCGAGLDERIYLATTKSKDSDSWFRSGFYGDEAYTYNSNYPDNIVPNADTWFLFDMQEQVWDIEDVDAEYVETSNCTDWDRPYYLREQFNGCIYNCGWTMSEDICFDGFFRRDKDDSYFTIYKNGDVASVEKNRYVSMFAEINPIEYKSSGETKISLYDSEGKRLVTVSVGENESLITENGGNSNKQADITFGEKVEISVHIDMQADLYDLYYNGSLVGSDLKFVDSLYNTDDVRGIRISNYRGKTSIDNLNIVATDQNNKITMPSEGSIETPDKDEYICGLFVDKDISCTSDAQCSTGDCYKGKCSKFDYTYCDENGYARGNKCMLAGIFNCVLGSIKNFIFNNFLMFAVLVLLIMAGAYARVVFGSSK